MKNDVKFAEIFYGKQMPHSAFIPAQIMISLKKVYFTGPDSAGPYNGIEFRFDNNVFINS
jgi:hypothetical protein